MVLVLVMNIADRICGYGDDVCVGIGDVSVGLRLR